MITTEQAVRHLIECLKESKEPCSFYDAWKSNIAMAIFDTFPDRENFDGFDVHSFCNAAAEKFLARLMNEIA